MSNEELLKECLTNMFSLGTVFTPTTKLEDDDFNDFVPGETYVISTIWLRLESDGTTVAEYGFECLSNRFKDYCLSQYTLELNVAKGNLKELPAGSVKKLGVKYHDQTLDADFVDTIYVDAELDLNAVDINEYLSTRICDRYHDVPKDGSDEDSRDKFNILSVSEIKE